MSEDVSRERLEVELNGIISFLSNISFDRVYWLVIRLWNLERDKKE